MHGNFPTSHRLPLLRALSSGALLLFALAGCGQSTPSSFNAHLDVYLKVPNPPDNAPRAHDGSDRSRNIIEPKLIPVDVDKKQIDTEIYHALPEEWRAKTPDEVKTIVQIRWKEIGETTLRNRKVPIIKFEATIIDKATNQEIAFAGTQRGVNPRSSERAELVKEMAVEIVRQCKIFAKN